MPDQIARFRHLGARMVRDSGGPWVLVGVVEHYKKRVKRAFDEYVQTAEEALRKERDERRKVEEQFLLYRLEVEARERNLRKDFQASLNAKDRRLRAAHALRVDVIGTLRQGIEGKLKEVVETQIQDLRNGGDFDTAAFLQTALDTVFRSEGKS